MDETSREPKASVIIRTKDRPAMLRRALSSILSQEEQRWEALIVNDGGSPAAVDEVIAEYAAAAAGRVRVLHHETSLGRWPSANAGVTGTSAPYVVLHDDDDSWHPEFLSRTVRYLDENPDEWGVIVRTDVIHEQYEEDGSLRETWRYLLEAHHDRVLTMDIVKFNRFVPISFLYRRTLHDRVGLYDASLPAAADWAFNMQTLALRPLNYVDDDVLAYWHQRPGVDGTQGNSVFAAPADHREADRAHRDDALREYIANQGWGLPLFLSALSERHKREAVEIKTENEAHLAELRAQIVGLDEAIARLQHHLDRTMDARIRGFVWRQKQRMRKRFGK